MKKKIKICKGCGIEKEVSINNKSEYCNSCSQKNRFGSLEMHNSDLWKSSCERCGDIRTYTHIKSWKQRKKLCVSCSQIKNDEHYNRDYQKYKGKVWTETNKQPLYILENFDKRGKSGIDGAYQLDHIISIKYGFENKIHPKIIGNMDNLQMIRWQENRKKGYK